MKGVLVTGATTPVGEELVRELLDHPDMPTVLAVGIEEDHEWPTHERLRYERADLTRPRDVRRLLFGPARKLRLDTVMHTALHRSAQDVGGRAYALNVESTRELLSLSERHPTIRRFVFRSHADVYRIDPKRHVVLSEEDPVDLSLDSPQRVRDRVEADLTVCTRMGLSPMSIAVLRCAEAPAGGIGSQLFDYLSTPVCLRPAGFDPMLNLITIEDTVRAMVLAAQSNDNGIFNVPGADTLPLSLAIKKWGRTGVPIPGPLLAPAYRLRASALGLEFRYDMNFRRFHFSAILDGRRARRALRYVPEVPIAWPVGGPIAQSPAVL